MRIRKPAEVEPRVTPKPPSRANKGDENVKHEILTGMMVFVIATTMAPTPADAQTDNSRPPIAIIYDASGSMDDPPPKGKQVYKRRIDAARAGVEAYGVKYTTDQDQIWYFQGCNDIQQTELDFNKRNPLHHAIESIEPKESTPLYDSIDLVAKSNHDRGKSVSIVLMTDGEDSCNGLAHAGVDNACDFARQLKEKYREIDLVVNPIGLWVDEKTSKELACMAKITGGVYTLVENPKDIPGAIAFASAKKGKVVMVDHEGHGIGAARFEVKNLRRARGSVFLDEGTYSIEIKAGDYYPECGDRTTTVNVKEGETIKVPLVEDSSDPCINTDGW